MKYNSLSTSKDTWLTGTEQSAKAEQTPLAESVLPDLTDPEEARKAFVASEIFRRKY